MLKSMIILPDGTEISSGDPSGTAIRFATLTQSVNSGTELKLGSACTNELEVSLYAETDDISLKAGDEIQFYKIDDSGERTKVGLFTLEKPTRIGTGTYKFLAYDRVIRLDKDLTDWLASLTNWPYLLSDLAEMVCEKCGLTLKSGEIPNGSTPVQAFSGSGVTGRNIMQWIGEASCRFVRATPDGEIEFAWYEDTGKTIPATGTGTFLGGSLKYEEYTTKAIEKVQIQQNEDDVGTIYPSEAEAESNTYKITGNPLLTAEDSTTLVDVAKTAYAQLQGVQYTPCTVSVAATTEISAGDILTVTTRDGKNVKMYVMSKKQSGQKDTLECTGSYSRDSVTAVNNLTLKALNGKVLNLRRDVDGLRVENKDTAGKLAAIDLNLEGITATVESQSESMDTVQQSVTALQQTADGLKVSVEKVQTEGVSQVKTEKGFSFNDDGLTISQSGSAMENRLDETGMYVTRSGETILQANNTGVVATDVSVRNYLIIGQHARFEDYESDRTACFWI